MFNLMDAVQRMTTADTLTGSRSISCLSNDLVTLKSIRSFMAPSKADIASQMADSIYSSANDQGDDHAITEALKVYRRAARLKPSNGASWWGIGNCFEFWGARIMLYKARCRGPPPPAQSRWLHGTRFGNAAQGL
jgi:hypothetical protein